MAVKHWLQNPEEGYELIATPKPPGKEGSSNYVSARWQVE